MFVKLEGVRLDARQKAGTLKRIQKVWGVVHSPLFVLRSFLGILPRDQARLYCPGLQIEARQAQGRPGATKKTYWYHQTLNGRLPLEDTVL